MESELSQCPYCSESVNPEARFCRACGRALKDARDCPFCAEPILKQAVRCRYCGSWLTEKELRRLDTVQQGNLPPIDQTISSSPIGAFLTLMSLTAIIYPPELRVTRENIHLRRWTLFGLRVFDQKVSTRKVASVRSHKGIIWTSITLETHGGAMADLTLPALNIQEAQEMVQVLESVIQERPGGMEDDAHN